MIYRWRLLRVERLLRKAERNASPELLHMDTNTLDFRRTLRGARGLVVDALRGLR